MHCDNNLKVHCLYKPDGLAAPIDKPSTLHEMKEYEMPLAEIPTAW